MPRGNRSARRSLILSSCALGALLLCHLALTDIWHGEGDLTLEWWMLRVGLLVIALAQVSTLVTLRRLVFEGDRA